MSEFLTIIHTCEDFGIWKLAYDADAPYRAASDLTDLILLRQMDEPYVIGLIFGLTDRVKTTAFLKSDRLRMAMIRAGIVGTPTITYREGSFTPAGAATYLTMNCSIGGIDKFRTYAMDATDRIEAA
jgi:hypothetical protein